MSPSTAFSVLIPARLASSRLPNKPLADLCGLPMVVRVAQRAALSAANRVVVATDHPSIAQACSQHGIQCVMTRSEHASGSDRIAEACAQLPLSPAELIVNVQGDEPLIDPTLINQVAETLAVQPGCAMSTAAHPIHDPMDFMNPNVVKVVLNQASQAMYFSRAPIAWWRDGMPRGSAAPIWNVDARPALQPLRHVGLYAYRQSFLQSFPTLEPCPLEHTEMLEQLRAMWYGERIAVHVTHSTPAAGVDTPEDLERVRAVLACN